MQRPRSILLLLVYLAGAGAGPAASETMWKTSLRPSLSTGEDAPIALNEQDVLREIHIISTADSTQAGQVKIMALKEQTELQRLMRLAEAFDGKGLPGQAAEARVAAARLQQEPRITPLEYAPRPAPRSQEDAR